jgi:dimethylhistidine N-methyltransferase
MTTLTVTNIPAPAASHAALEDAASTEVAAGLLMERPSISPKFFYDSLGSMLFEAICELPEYYPTRTEADILRRCGSAIASAVAPGCTLIDLGAGNCAKAAGLFPLLRPAHYAAVDISAEFVQHALDRLQPAFPHIAMEAVAMDFSSQFSLPATVPLQRRLFFYPGSSIGNFAPHEAHSLLRRLRAACESDGGLLIGIDLVKDPAVLEAAYDDGLGVTAAFNLNVLRHVNRILDSDFDVRDWRHVAFFNAAAGRIEMHLEARRDVVVSWPGERRAFGTGERIHTENSYKYRLADAIALLQRAGFGAADIWTDEQQWFALIHARPLAS